VSKVCYPIRYKANSELSCRTHGKYNLLVDKSEACLKNNLVSPKTGGSRIRHDVWMTAVSNLDDNPDLIPFASLRSIH
jgi:hypothetical protein